MGGSAPLVWGTFYPPSHHKNWRRFSPTGVGNVLFGLASLAITTVQPHWCGERTL